MERKGIILMITGDRHLRPPKGKTIVWDALDSFLVKHGKPALVIHGGNRGADEIADAWARHQGVEVRIYRPNTKVFGVHAGARRNDEMLTVATHLIAFPSRKGRLAEWELREDERMKRLKAPPWIVWV